MGKTRRKYQPDGNPNGCRHKWDMPHKSATDYKRIKIRPQDIPDEYFEDEEENSDPQEENWQDYQDGDDWWVNDDYPEDLNLENSTEATLGNQQQSPVISHHPEKVEEEEKHQ